MREDLINSDRGEAGGLEQSNWRVEAPAFLPCNFICALVFPQINSNRLRDFSVWLSPSNTSLREGTDFRVKQWLALWAGGRTRECEVRAWKEGCILAGPLKSVF